MKHVYLALLSALFLISCHPVKNPIILDDAVPQTIPDVTDTAPEPENPLITITSKPVDSENPVVVKKKGLCHFCQKSWDLIPNTRNPNPGVTKGPDDFILVDHYLFEGQCEGSGLTPQALIDY